MESIPVLWSWENLVEMKASGATYTEERGPKDGFLQFELSVLDDGTKDDGYYLHVFVSVTDTCRPNDKVGGCKFPLCTSFLYFDNGQLDMPLAGEVYDTLSNS